MVEGSVDRVGATVKEMMAEMGPVGGGRTEAKEEVVENMMIMEEDPHIAISEAATGNNRVLQRQPPC